jgi:hypothetical protein
MDSKKTCTKCGEVKCLSLYYKDKTKPDGLEKQCKQCRSSTQQKYYSANKVEIDKRNKAWVKQNTEKVLETQREYQRKKYKLIGNVRRSASRAKMRQRTPLWADMSAIAAVYSEAKKLTEETGVQHHVDHVIPMNAELVSGLHVHYNLQILTAEENLKKSNKYVPD